MIVELVVRWDLDDSLEAEDPQDVLDELLMWTRRECEVRNASVSVEGRVYELLAETRE